MRIAMVETHPRDNRGRESANLGFEIICNIFRSHNWIVDKIKWWDKINVEEYDVIGFNVIYLPNQLNIVPFLQQNNIEIDANKRNKKPLLIGGGAGFINTSLMNGVLDYIVCGDGEKFAEKMATLQEIVKDDLAFYHHNELCKIPILNGSGGTIELTRGCKYRCKFCSYGWLNGKYREQNLDEVIRQIKILKRYGIKRINFLSCNFSGYSKIKELIAYCIDNRVHITNTDFRIDDYVKLSEQRVALEQRNIYGERQIINPIDYFRTLKVGLETPYELARYMANKRISDEDVNKFLDLAVKRASYIHFYMIYGLPGDDYNAWWDFIRRVKSAIKNEKHDIRIEFSITNFEPTPHTPYANEPPVNFEEKNKFLQEYFKVMKECEFINPKEQPDYSNMRGRIGRKPENYKAYMWLLTTRQSLLNTPLSYIKGVGRTLSDDVVDYIDCIVGSNPTPANPVVK